MESKYIVIKLPGALKMQFSTIIVFPEYIRHKDMAKRLLSQGQKVLGAGFCTSAKGCYGRSETLDIGSTPGDTMLYRMYISGEF